MNHPTFKLFILFLLFSTLTACGKKFTVINNTPTTPTPAAETDFCSTSTSYSPGVAVSGTAKFLRRGALFQVNSGVVVSATTGSVIATPLPIKYAEIRVVRVSTGAVVQCGTTNNIGELRALDGTSPLFLPNDAADYKIQVNARAYFTFPSAGKPVSATLNAAVKQDPITNTIHAISGTLTSSGFGGSTNAPLNLVAQANESVSAEIEGGAFNIYNDWVTTFEYLTSTSNTGSLDISCLNTRLGMFWKAGFNPMYYIDSNSDPSNTLSYYQRDDNELYICGGVQGNVSSADTDHWDDSVIIHEIGHHIENVCGNMDSPGGTHYAQYRIDPRLAWSEAWGNFMGAHIIKNNTAKINPNLTSALPNGEWMFYNDTKGYNDGATLTGSQLILMRLNKSGSGSGLGPSHDAVDPATYAGESHTREASIARGLFKGTNSCSGNCGGGVTFDKYWSALIAMTTTPFSSSAKFLQKVYVANSSSFTASMTSILTADESLHLMGSTSFTVTATSSSTGAISTNAWPAYGVKLTTNSSCNQNVLQPRSLSYAVNNPATFGKDADQRYNNHFFSIRKSDLAGVSEIKLVPDSSCTVDLDLVVLNSAYQYNEDCTSYNSSGSCITFGKTTSSYVATYSRGSTNSETVSLSGLGTGYYLLNVRGYSSTPSSISNTSSCIYKLTNQSGVTLCPSTSY